MEEERTQTPIKMGLVDLQVNSEGNPASGQIFKHCNHYSLRGRGGLKYGYISSIGGGSGFKNLEEIRLEN